METHKSKLSPQDPQWFRDLPERDQSQEVAPGLGIESVHRLDARWLDLTRETTHMRGVFLLFGGFCLGGSIFATFISSISFLGLPAKAYAGNWNAFVFSLSIPVAAGDFWR